MVPFGQMRLLTISLIVMVFSVSFVNAQNVFVRTSPDLIRFLELNEIQLALIGALVERLDGFEADKNSRRFQVEREIFEDPA